MPTVTRLLRVFGVVCSSNHAHRSILLAGIYVQSPHFDGYVPTWHHWTCYASKKVSPLHCTLLQTTLRSSRLRSSRALSQIVLVLEPFSLALMFTACREQCKITSTSDIAGFTDLKFDDQQRIKGVVAGAVVPAAPAAAVKGGVSGEQAVTLMVETPVSSKR